MQNQHASESVTISDSPKVDPDCREGSHTDAFSVPLRHSGRKPGLLMLNYFIISFIALVPPYIIGFELTVNAAFLGLGLIVSGCISEFYDRKLDLSILKKRKRRLELSDKSA